MGTCPTCGKEVATTAGMRQHHTKVHGEPLANRKCRGCGSEFYDEDARRQFCDNCNPNGEENNGNWQDARETTTCDRCERQFEYYPSNKRGLFCPDCVEESDEFLGTPYAETVDASKVNRECDFCDHEMTVLKSERKRGNGRFCSRECLSGWMSENRVGENHHQWIDGAGTYTGKWWSARKQALQRDGFQCMNCGKTADEIGRNPDVHHIIPVRAFDEPEAAHTLDNLVCLCRSCHRHVEEGTIAVPDTGESSRQK